MKRIVSLILALVLLAGAAFAAPGDANLGMDMHEKYNDSVMGAAVMGDTLYLMGYSNLYTWKTGEADLTPIPFVRPEAEDMSVNMERMFTDGESLYCLMTQYTRENWSFHSASICEIIVEDGAVTFGDPVELENEDLLVDYGDGGIYLAQINGIVSNGDYAFFQMYDDNGNPRIYAMDMFTMEGSFIDLELAQACALYEDGQLLVASFDWQDEGILNLYIYDPVSESLTPACESVKRDRYLSGMAYSQESGRLFYLEGGYVKAATDFDFENAQSVAELSMGMNSDAMAMLLPGDYYVLSTHEVTSVRSTQPDALPETTLVLSGEVYYESINQSYYSFGNRHGDVAVVLSTDYQQDSKIIEAMMNRDASADIYVMGVSRQAYDALYNRGYMAEFDNEELIARVQRMYPAIQAPLTKDGRVVAVPVSLYGWQMGLNYEGFERIGVTRDQIPTDWAGFVEFLATVPDLLPEDGSVKLTESAWMTQEYMSNQLTSSILTCYQNETAAHGETADYASPELEQALQAVQDFDFSVFGLAETYEELEENGGAVWFFDSSANRTTLMEFSIGMTLGNFYSNSCEPALMTIDPAKEPLLPVEMTVAFINPFTKNYALAQEFLLEMCNNMDAATRYNISDELNEPRRYSWYEENLKPTQESIDQMKLDLENADPVDKPLLEQAIAENERYLNEVAINEWEIAPKDIEWYRGNADRLFVTRFNYLNGGDGAGEFWELRMKMYEGLISVQDFLKEAGQKARMMELEGN